MLKTKFTEMVGCAIPIQEAPIATWPRLAVAVANAGGLGMLSGSGVEAGQIAEMLEKMSTQTKGVFGVNFLPFDNYKLAKACVEAAAARARVIDFFYFDPDPLLVKVVHTAGALAGWSHHRALRRALGHPRGFGQRLDEHAGRLCLH